MRKYFLTGLLVWAPLAITIWVITWGLGALDGVFGSVMAALIAVMPEGLRPALANFRNIPGLGIVLVLGVIFLTGMFAANIAGRWALRQSDRLLQQIPIVRSIYSSVKQVSDTLFSSNGNAFRKALLVQYPHQGSWTMAFLTGAPGGEVASHLTGEHVSVYVPTTPNPTSGFFLMMPKSEVVELDMSVDEALKYIISMGVVVPNGVPHPAPSTEPRSSMHPGAES